jgi:TonB family protein
MHTLRSGFCAVILGLSLVAGAQQTAGEYQVKAAYVYKFAKMAHWSAEKLPDGANLIIGVLGGKEDFVKVLRNALAGKSVEGHALEVRHLRSLEELKSCHMVFFRASERTTRAVIAHLGKTTLLLVGEDSDFLNEGGMISLVLVDGKITYEVDSAALEGANIHYDDASAASTKSETYLQPESARPIAFRVVPEYPRIAASLKITGAVQLQAIVRANGTVKQVLVVGGHPVLAEAAAAAVMHWHFEPAAKETTESVKVSFGP